MKPYSFIRLKTKTYAYSSAKDEILYGVLPEANTLAAEPFPLFNPIILIPTESVLLTTVSLPKTSAAKIKQAIPYSIEEELADDLENLHIAIGKQSDTGQVPLAVIEKNKLIQYLEQSEALSYTTNIFLPEALALPYIPHHWFILIEKEQSLIRLDNYRGLAVETEELQNFIQVLLKENLPPEKIYVAYTEASLSLIIKKLYDFRIPIEVASEITTSEKVFIEGLAAQPILPINLLQNEFKFKKPNWLTLPWKKLMYIAGGLTSLWLVTEISAWVMLTHQNKSLVYKIHEYYDNYFPHETAPPDFTKSGLIKAFQTLAHRSDHDFFFNITLAVGKQLAAQNEDLNITKFDYQNNTLVLELMAQDFSALNEFSHVLATHGYLVKQSDAKAETGRVTARLTIKRIIK